MEVPWELPCFCEVTIGELPTRKTVPSGRSWYCNKKRRTICPTVGYKEGSIV